MWWAHSELDLASVRRYWTWTWTLSPIEAEKEMAGWNGTGKMKENDLSLQSIWKAFGPWNIFSLCFLLLVMFSCMSAQCPSSHRSHRSHFCILFFSMLLILVWSGPSPVSEKKTISIMEYFNQNIMRVVRLPAVAATHSPDEADQLSV